MKLRANGSRKVRCKRIIYMKLSKSILLIMFLQFLFSPLTAQTELERLWKKAENYSPDIYSAQKDTDYSRYLAEHTLLLYPLSLSLSGKPTFYRHYEQYPDSLNVLSSSASLSQELPGGLTVGLGASLDRNRGYMNYDFRNGYTDTGYSDNPVLQLSLVQSLNPYWLHGQWKDPQKELLKISASQSSYNKDATKSSVMRNVANNYIQYRRIERMIKLTDKSLDLQALQLEALWEMYKNGQMPLAQIWNVENDRTNTLNNLNSYLEQQKNVYITLCNYCGSIGTLNIKAKLPDRNKRMFDYNPARMSLGLEAERLKKQYLLDKQDAAPKLSFTGDFSESSKLSEEKGINLKDKDNYISYDFTLALTFNDLYPGSYRARNKKYETDSAKTQKQVESYNAQFKAEKEYLAKVIELYNQDFEQAQGVYDRSREKLVAYRDLYKQGLCTRMELLSVQNEKLNAECNVMNIKDMLWYAQWSLTQCVE